MVASPEHFNYMCSSAKKHPVAVVPGALGLVSSGLCKSQFIYRADRQGCPAALCLISCLPPTVSLAFMHSQSPVHIYKLLTDHWLQLVIILFGHIPSHMWLLWRACPIKVYSSGRLCISLNFRAFFITSSKVTLSLVSISFLSSLNLTTTSQILCFQIFLL